jgi:hypothetical protein
VWYVYDQQGGCIEKFDRERGFSYTLSPGEARLFQFIPVNEPVCVIGMTDKYISGAGVQEVRMFEDSCVLQTRCGGTLSLVSERSRIRQVMIRRQKTGICMEADWLQEGLIIRIGDLQAGDVVQVFW